MNQIIQGDCLEVMKTFEPNMIDITVTSPPYDNLRTYDGIINQWNEQKWKDIIQELYRITKIGGVVAWVVGDATIKGSETGTSFKQALWAMECGFNLHDTMIYQKINYVPLTHNRYEQSFEYMFIMSKEKPATFNPIKILCDHPGKIEKYGLKRRQNHGKNHAMRIYEGTEYLSTKNTKIASNIFSYTLGKEKTGHPAPFQEQLAHDHILSWSNEGDLVLDPMCGSGTTCKMAKILNRNYIGIELNPEYVEIAKNRLNGELFKDTI